MKPDKQTDRLLSKIGMSMESPLYYADSMDKWPKSGLGNTSGYVNHKGVEEERWNRLRDWERLRENPFNNLHYLDLWNADINIKHESDNFIRGEWDFNKLNEVCRKLIQQIHHVFKPEYTEKEIELPSSEIEVLLPTLNIKF